jgi:hypothetical protein
VEAYTGFEPQVGQIAALRTFRIGPGGWLHPLFSQEPWQDGSNTARCLRTDVEPHPAPDPGCRCGFYAYGSTQAVEYPQGRHVLAVVECWGRVIAGTRGVRAEHSRIVALWLSRTVPADLAAQIRQNYPSVALHRDRQRMTAERPLTELDCYERLRPDSSVGGWPLWVVAVAAAVLGSLPGDWLGGARAAGLLLTVTATVFVVAGLLLQWRRSVGAPRRSLLCFAVALWLLASFLGPAGLVLVRLPLLQAAVVAGLHRTLVAREARRIPARIS